MKRLSVILLVLAVGVAAVVFYRLNKPVVTQSKSAPTPVETTQVSRQVLPQVITALGSLTAIHQVNISPEIAGQVAKVLMLPGDHVKKGQALVDLDDAVYRAQFNAAKADLKLSQLNYQRQQTLAKKGLNARQALDSALADLQDKQSALHVTETKLFKTVLRAPFTGVLGVPHISIGEYITAGQTVVNLVDKQHLKVQYQVSERYLSTLKLLQAVTVHSNAYPDQNFTGKVSFISPVVDVSNRTVLVQATVDNHKQALAPGMFVNVKQQLGDAQAVVAIPEQALVPILAGDSVYTVVNGKAMQVMVTTGLHTKSSVEILSGIKPGDTIVTAGQQKLKEGMMVVRINL